jgi:hypothetical protein
VTRFPKISAIKLADSVAVGMAHRCATENVVASFQRSIIVVRWEEVRGCLVAAVVHEEVDSAQEVDLHEQVEDETGDMIS